MKKWNLEHQSQSCLGDIFVSNWKTGKPAAFDVTVTSSVQYKFLLNTALKAFNALDAEDKLNIASMTIKSNKCASLLLLSTEFLVEYWQLPKRTLKRLAVFGYNRSFTEGNVRCVHKISTILINRGISGFSNYALCKSLLVYCLTVLNRASRVRDVLIIVVGN